MTEVVKPTNKIAPIIGNTSTDVKIDEKLQTKVDTVEPTKSNQKPLIDQRPMLATLVNERTGASRKSKLNSRFFRKKSGEMYSTNNQPVIKNKSIKMDKNPSPQKHHQQDKKEPTKPQQQKMVNKPPGEDQKPSKTKTI